jgi:hypothetical protein
MSCNALKLVLIQCNNKTRPFLPNLASFLPQPDTDLKNPPNKCLHAKNKNRSLMMFLSILKTASLVLKCLNFFSPNH